MMNPDSDSRDPVEQLAEEFLERRRRGETATAEQYAAEHPELAGAILDLFPTMLALEQLGGDTPGGSAPAAGFEHPQQLGELRLVREIGRGGMGIVYEAEQESLSRRVAVKVLPERTLLDTKRLERFRREARTAAGLQHPHIVPIYGVGEQEGLHYIVMQLVEGAGLDTVAEIVGRRARAMAAAPTVGPDATTPGSPSAPALPPSAVTREGDWLADSLAAALVTGDFDATVAGSHAGFGPQPPASSDQAPTVALSDSVVEAALEGASLVLDSDGEHAGQESAAVGSEYFQSLARIGIQAAEALAYAHARGTLHRDIKPANLLLDRRGDVWITDFGLAKAMDAFSDGRDDLSRSGELVGTLRYMAPEQLGGAAGPRSDLYSLGLTLYELITFRPAFEASAPSALIRKITTEAPPAPRKLNPSTPRDLETIVLKAIAREPEDRYQSGDDLAADLRRYLEAAPIAARREGVARRGVRWWRRNPLVAGLAAAVVLLSVTSLFGLGAMLMGPAPPLGDPPEVDAFEPSTPVAPAPVGRPRERENDRGDRRGPPPGERRGPRMDGDFRPPRGERFAPDGRPLPPGPPPNKRGRPQERPFIERLESEERPFFDDRPPRRDGLRDLPPRRPPPGESF